MPIKFTKMHGLGNDFMVIDATQQPCSLSAEQIRQLADRRYGVGFDQLLIVGASYKADIDFTYLIFNADGSSAEQCGNGARCIAQFIHEQKLSTKKQLKIQAPKTVLELVLLGNNQILASMGIPDFSPQHLPMHTEQTQAPYSIPVDNNVFEGYIVNIGNPHVIFLVEQINSNQIETLGKRLNQHPLFPQGVNVSFVQRIDTHCINLQVYERGAGQTLACGSAACASATIAIQQGWAHSPVTVNQPGGKLIVSWAGTKQAIMMQGPAQTVYQGEYLLALHP